MLARWCRVFWPVDIQLGSITIHMNIHTVDPNVGFEVDSNCFGVGVFVLFCRVGDKWFMDQQDLFMLGCQLLLA